jgi:hypothetical protein
MGYYVYRKFYFPQAQNKWQALDFLREAEEKEIVKDFFISQWAKEDNEDKGWLANIKKQLRGK